MERRAIMVDVDDVLVAHPDPRGWTADLERDLGVPVAGLQQLFFAPHWDDVVHGRAPLRERLAPVLAQLSPTVSCDALIDYWFGNDAHLDTRLLDELATLRDAGTEVHLATVQEHERACYLWESLDLRSRFDGLHYAAALGCSKPDPCFYRAVAAAVALEPAAIFFIDDKPANVEAARACGWTAAVWTGRETVGELMRAQGWAGK